jgi:hypothetical protein
MLWLNLGILNLGAGVICHKRHVIERPGYFSLYFKLDTLGDFKGGLIQ